MICGIWRKSEFDLIFMDVQMPEMSSLQAIMQIRREEDATGRQVPIIAMTASAMTGGTLFRGWHGQLYFQTSELQGHHGTGKQYFESPVVAWVPALLFLCPQAVKAPGIAIVINVLDLYFPRCGKLGHPRNLVLKVVFPSSHSVGIFHWTAPSASPSWLR
jgi:hypothetical protein